jgi:hypothetical protein
MVTGWAPGGGQCGGVLGGDEESVVQVEQGLDRFKVGPRELAGVPAGGGGHGFIGVLDRDPGGPGLPGEEYRGLADGAPAEVSVFRTREMRPGPGALCTSGTAVPAPPRVNLAAAACRLAMAGPCHPGPATHPGMFSSRGISKGPLSFAPPGHSPHLRPPDGTDVLIARPAARRRAAGADLIGWMLDRA